MELFQLIFNIAIFGAMMALSYGVMKALDHFGLTEEEIEAYERQLEEIEQERLNEECDKRLATQKRKEINLNDL